MMFRTPPNLLLLLSHRCPNCAQPPTEAAEPDIRIEGDMAVFTLAPALYCAPCDAGYLSDDGIPAARIVHGENE